MRILLVEDDMALSQGLTLALKQEGYVVDPVHTGKDALHVLSANATDLVVLDLGLPDMDGLSVLKSLRHKHATMPVLVLTARDTSHDKVKGLDLGADDYLAKPFDMPELLARLRVMTRHLGTATSRHIHVGEVCLDSKAHEVTISGEPVVFSRKEFMVLKALMESAGQVQTREQLESKLYAWGEEVASNAVEVHVHHLRKKLPQGFIKTIRGVGYTLSTQ